MKIQLLALAFLLVCGSASAQKKKYSKKQKKVLKEYYFNEGFQKPATKKVSIITMKDGTKRKGYVKRVRTKRGQINTLIFRDSITDEKEKIEAKDIAEALMYASGFEKFNKVGRKIERLGMGQRKSVRKATSNDQIYFVNQTVSIKNKKDEKEFLMQLINPDFDDIISVYYDPFASQSGGFSTGGVTFGGGVLKSYYVKKGDKIIWLRKKKLKENYDFLFGDNPEFVKKYPANSINWDWFSALVLKYTVMSLDS